MTRLYLSIAALAAGLLASEVSAAPAVVPKPPPASANKPAVTPITIPPPVAAVDAYHAALHFGEKAIVLKILAPDVTFYEQGFEEVSRDAYSGAHLSADLDFAKNTQYIVISRKLLSLGPDAAVVLTRFRNKGQFSGQTIDLVGTETDVMQRVGPDWIIKHVHTSAHPADQDKP